MAMQIRWLSSKEASDLLGVNLRTLYRFIDEGHLAAYKFGRVIRVKEVDVTAFVEASRIVPGSIGHLYPEPLPPTLR
jgi:excisionase family DNA binding protein